MVPQLIQELTIIIMKMEHIIMDNSKKKCIHYWLISQPDAEGKCFGKCKYCGSIKYYENQLHSDYTWRTYNPMRYKVRGKNHYGEKL